MGIFEETITKSSLKKALKKQLVLVNGRIASTATIINGGETIELLRPEEQKAKKQLVFPLKVVLEDDFLALINKPSGLLVSGNKFRTLANALPNNLKKCVADPYTIPQPVHRLDYGTSGLLLIGKSKKSIRVLNKMFEDRKIKKTYYAICIGEMESEGQINLEIDGKEAVTNYTCMDVVSSEKFTSLSLVKLFPKTGRRHQLRKHLAAIGNPILGDKEYGKESLLLSGKGLYLHAYALEFLHPISKEELHITVDLPQKFRRIFPR